MYIVTIVSKNYVKTTTGDRQGVPKSFIACFFVSPMYWLFIEEVYFQKSF